MIDKKKLITEKLQNSLSYKQFRQLSERNVKGVNTDFINEMERAYYNYRKLNLARVTRLEKSYHPTEEAKNIFSKITAPQIWLVITEDWCGDSAQTLPVIAALSELNDNISLKIILRNNNLDLMDLYLTHGKRSIPKLISFDKELNELFVWGPRPSQAITLINDLTKQGVSKQEVTKQLHLWYAKDGGFTTEKELLAKLIK